MIYLYHPQILIAHTARLEGYRPMPDGLMRVIGRQAEVRGKRHATGCYETRAGPCAFASAPRPAALAQTNLRIGLGDDGDVLDPTLSRFYTTRIVFAALCDKLFDIDEKGNIVPQLALGSETSADGKTVTMKLRPGVKFHDGEPFDAAAAKYSLDRHLTMKGSFRRSEISVVDSVEVVDPLTIKLNLKAPFSPLLAQLTDRAGMMMAPKATEAAGDKFALHPVCAGPYKFVERIAQDRIVVEKFADYWNKDQVFIDKITYRPIVDATVRLANLKSGSLDLIERVLATDIKDGALQSQAQAQQGDVARLVRPADQHEQRAEVEQSAGQGPAGAPGLRARARPRGHQPGGLQRRVRAGQPVGQPAEPVLSEGLPRPQARPRQGQGADAGGRRQDAGDDRLHGDQRARDAGRRRGGAGDGRPRRAST